MPGFSGLSNQSCERRLLPLGWGVCPFFLAIRFPPQFVARECAESRRNCNWPRPVTPAGFALTGRTPICEQRCGSEPADAVYVSADDRDDLRRKAMTPFAGKVLAL